MSKVIAAITTSVDGYVTGPDDGPQYGLGRGGERLHYWVMGGPWTYEGGHDFEMRGTDKELFEGFDRDADLEVVKVYSSPFATHVRYAVKR